MQLIEKFQQSTLPKPFYWFNEPAKYQLGTGLEIFTDEKTDFWQNTHYGFQRDDGHCLLTRLAGDFSLMTHVEFRPQEMYDRQMAHFVESILENKNNFNIKPRLSQDLLLTF